MKSAKDRSANRQKRRLDKRNNHEPLLHLVREEISRKPVKARVLEITPLNDAQRRYDKAMRANLITFGVGPAGTGKTYLAALRAAEALVNHEIEKIVITRPAIEAGESLGFLPGELGEKFEPYFRPVKDALEEYLGSSHLEYLLKTGAIEARPLAFLRGATIKNAWLIADEMQNATKSQMKMLLTRIGENAKFIINGDPSQCDLPNLSDSGLEDAVRRTGQVNGVCIVHFDEADIVRHGIVQDLVKAYSLSHVNPDPERYIDDEDSADELDGLHRMLKPND